MDLDRDIPDHDAETLAPFLIGGLVLTVASALGVMMSAAQSGLTRRERLVASVSTATLGVVGVVAASRAPGFATRSRQDPKVVVVGLAGVSATGLALGGGHRTPAFFPAITATALGGGYLAPVDAARYGVVVGSVHAVGSIISARPWRPGAPDVWFPVASAVAFPVAAVVGSKLGVFSYRLRSLELTRRRDRRTERTESQATAVKLETSRAEVARVAADLIAAVREIVELPGVQAAERQNLRDRGDRSLAWLEDLREGAAGVDQSPDGGGEGLVQRVRRRARQESEDDVDICVETEMSITRDISPDTAVALELAVRRGLVNAKRHNAKRPLTVNVRLETTADRAQEVRISVEDDGGGSPAAPVNFGRGLRSSRRELRRLGGDLDLLPGARGVRLEGHASATEVQPAPPPRSFIQSTDDLARETFAALRVVTVAQATAIVISQTRRPDLARTLLRLSSVLGIAEALVRKRPAFRAPAAFAAVAAFPGSGRPAAGGWAATILVELTYVDGKRQLPAAVATTTAALLAGYGHLASEFATTIGDRMFPAFASAAGLLLHRQRRRLERAESEVASLADRVAVLDGVSAIIERPHEWQSLRHSAVWPDVVTTPQGARYVHLEERLEVEGERLLPLLTLTGRAFDLMIEQLEFRLFPAVVRADGADLINRLPPRRTIAVGAVNVGRERLWLIQLTDELAERLLAAVPPDKFGRPRLNHVELTVTGVDEHGESCDGTEAYEVQIQLRPMAEDGARSITASDRALSTALIELGGTLMTLDPGIQVLRLDSEVFAR